MEVVRRLLRAHDAVMLQEVRGSRAELERELADTHRFHRIFYSAHEADTTGGVAMVVRRKFLEGSDVDWNELVPGRYALLTLAAGGGRAGMALAVVHNHGVGLPALRRVVGSMREAADRAAQAPQHWFFCVAGNYNFSAPGETALSAGAEATAAVQGPRVLADFLGRPTRVAESSTGGMHRIDRAYVAIPGWILSVCAAEVELAEPPEALVAAGISDHGALSLRLAG